ncbi:hypothetical protein AVEN_19694-1 [Araneus ventricosus]|uniref:Uncharacterized protein n=1 Tax=Araneus ventricosus TaxID=182803 RepID=A0A4Y2C4F8_ARAVE|nr:hypothetical protein AVEN_19694-1 [Araneus ventricosus]
MSDSWKAKQDTPGVPAIMYPANYFPPRPSRDCFSMKVTGCHGIIARSVILCLTRPSLQKFNWALRGWRMTEVINWASDGTTRAKSIDAQSQEFGELSQI